MAVQIRPASDYTIQQLVDVYNLTRSDYLVPMTMVPADLEEYLHVYDIALEGSVVALRDSKPVGLNLLGLRGEQGWITRLGVVPQARRQGVAGALMQALLEEAVRRGVRQMRLEVIADNDPGRALFQSFGFSHTAEFIVAERPIMDQATVSASQATVAYTSREEILEELGKRGGYGDWKNHLDSLSKLNGLKGLKVTSGSGTAWVAFRPKDRRLEKTILGIGSGQTLEMGSVALNYLSQEYPSRVLKAENIPAEGSTWAAYQRAGFGVSFRRVEMALRL